MLIALTLGIGVLYFGPVGPYALPKRFGIVEAGKLYRSGEMTPAALKHAVSQFGIRTVIDFGAHEPGSPEERREARTAKALGLSRYVLRLEGDGTGNLNNYARALEIMNDRTAQPVLVHCSAGTQRTGCAVALYSKMHTGAGIDKLLWDAARYGHDPEDNPHVRTILTTEGERIIDASKNGANLSGFDPVAPPVRSEP